MPSQRPYETYASELSGFGYGYPLWYPEPVDRGEVEIGDVGFIKDGAFVRIFNICQKKDSPVNKGNVPETFERLDYSSGVENHPHAIQGTICSQTATSRKVAGHIAGGFGATAAQGEIGYEYTCSADTTAVLLLNTGAYKRVIRHNTIFTNFIKKHHQDWCRYIKDVKDSTVDPSNVIVVRGWYKTDRWTVAVVNRSSSSHQGSVKVVLPCPVAGGASLGSHTTNVHIASRTGPKRSAIGTLRRSLSQFGTSRHLVPPGDQCVFLPHFQVKYRQLGLTEIKAHAGDHTLPDGGDGPESGRPIMSISVDSDDAARIQVSTDATPLDILLEYILENSTADFAIACEDDISSFFCGSAWSQNSLRAWLNQNRPRVEVEDGAGTIIPTPPPYNNQELSSHGFQGNEKGIYENPGNRLTEAGGLLGDAAEIAGGEATQSTAEQYCENYVREV